MGDRTPPFIRENTPEEEAEIARAIASDPDTWTVPEGTIPLRRGRPSGSTKEQVTVKIDRDVLVRLRADGKGWQTRLNAALRAALGM